MNLHEIQYDSSAPKSSLIEIFNKEIAPNSKKLLSEYNAKVENMNDDDFINASDFDKPSEKSTTSEKASALFVSDTESDGENEKIDVSKTRNKTKKVTKPKLRASSGNQKSTSRSSSRTKVLNRNLTQKAKMMKQNLPLDRPQDYHLEVIDQNR